MTIYDLQLNKDAIICKFNLNFNQKSRLKRLGLVVGSKVRLIRIATFGSPIIINVRNYYLSIRKSLAKQIEVKYE